MNLPTTALDPIDRRRMAYSQSIRDLVANAIDLTRIQVYDHADQTILASELIRRQVEIERRLREEERQRNATVREWLECLDLAYGLQSARARPNGFGGPVLYDADGIQIVCLGDFHVPSEWFSTALFRAVEITREYDANIDALQDCLSLLGRCIQTVFSQLLRPRFLFGLVVTQSPFFITHGNHPPHLSALGSPINFPGVCAA